MLPLRSASCFNPLELQYASSGSKTAPLSPSDAICVVPSPPLPPSWRSPPPTADSVNIWFLSPPSNSNPITYKRRRSRNGSGSASKGCLLRRSARLGSCGFRVDCIKQAEERKARLNGGLIISNSTVKIKLQESSTRASPIVDLGLLTTNMYSDLRSLPIAAQVEALGFRCNHSSMGSGSVLSDLAGGQISGFKHVDFLAMNAIGLAGGQLLIWNSEIWSMEDYYSGHFILAASLVFKQSGLRFWVASVYGPPHHSARSAFFRELVAFLNSHNDLLIMGGDFNVTMGLHERLNCTGSLHDSQKFSRIIANSNLIDLPIAGLLYTWSNGQNSARFAKLDRVLLSLSASNLLPTTVIHRGGKKLSDHHFLHFKSQNKVLTRSNIFGLESHWFGLASFKEMISKCWENINVNTLGLNGWTAQWRMLRKFIRQWAAILAKETKTNPLTLEEQVASLGGKADSIGLSPIETEEFRESKCRLDKLYGDEEGYWHHHAKQRWVKLGDRNTWFFQQCASLTKKRNWISAIDTSRGTLVDSGDIRDDFREYYSSLLGSNPSTGLEIN
ncbi:transposon protein [Canna indica]|uniref:Transposon protein n=1 Tax=Canna indica TaxID=4628 RepID=A0AAQ3KNA8_9LILI|nr:transposon protein [Canna indica]